MPLSMCGELCRHLSNWLMFVVGVVLIFVRLAAPLLPLLPLLLRRFNFFVQLAQADFLSASLP